MKLPPPHQRRSAGRWPRQLSWPTRWCHSLLLRRSHCWTRSEPWTGLMKRSRTAELPPASQPACETIVQTEVGVASLARRVERPARLTDGTGPSFCIVQRWGTMPVLRASSCRRLSATLGKTGLGAWPDDRRAAAVGRNGKRGARAARWTAPGTGTAQERKCRVVGVAGRTLALEIENNNAACQNSVVQQLLLGEERYGKGVCVCVCAAVGSCCSRYATLRLH